MQGGFASYRWRTREDGKAQGDAFASALSSHVPQPRTVLELGCGPGLLAEHILQRCPFIERYALLDFSPTMLELSRQRLQSFSERVVFLQVDFKQD